MYLLTFHCIKMELIKLISVVFTQQEWYNYLSHMYYHMIYLQKSIFLSSLRS